MEAGERRKLDRMLEDHGRRFHKSLERPAYPPPTVFKLMAFRAGRWTVQLELTEKDRDFTYYRDKGWFESAYWYPVRLGSAKQVAGKVFEWMGKRAARKRRS